MSVASMNDFKLLKNKCKRYFDIFEKSITFHSKPETDILKERFGFYLFMLENLCNEKNLDEISNFITDTEYNRYLYNINNEDHGVDAIYIDSQENEIKLFNFKYRENFNSDKKQSENELFISTKLINAIITENLEDLKGTLKEYIESIIKELNGSKIWKLSLYIVSNESLPINVNDSDIKNLENLYDLEIKPICLNHIKSMMSIRPLPINAELLLDKEALMSYSEDTISTNKSYIVRLSGSDIIRITCKDQALRDNYELSEIESLSKVKMDYGVLFDNVRGFIQNSKYNQAIEKTLKDEPNKFFMFNNGMTIVAKNIESKSTSAGKRLHIKIKDFQVLNGGQTLRTIHQFNEKNDLNITEFLSKSEILVRILNASDPESINKIAEFTNSQNSISSIDLKSLSSLQIQIEQYLNECEIIYARKNGDTGLDDQRNYRYKISMVQFGQILLSIQGHPDKPSNHKQHIFGKYYEQIFSEENFEITQSVEIIERYFAIRQKYSELGNNVQKIEQKIFYILYMTQYYKLTIEEAIQLLEDGLSRYKTSANGNVLTDARKLIQVGFKSFLNESILLNYSDSQTEMKLSRIKPI